MRSTPLLLLSTLSAVAAAARPEPPTRVLAARQAVVTPPPCERMKPAPSAAETEQRFNEFADAFLVEKNLTHAFAFIAEDYINHNPFVTANGSSAALDVLGPVWGTTEIERLRTEFVDPQGWLNYNTSGFGLVVDRFRWEAGCIVEHWDAGEVFPGDPTNTTASVSTTGSNSSSSSNSGSGSSSSSSSTGSDSASVSGAKRSVQHAAPGVGMGVTALLAIVVAVGSLLS